MKNYITLLTTCGSDVIATEGRIYPEKSCSLSDCLYVQEVMSVSHSDVVQNDSYMGIKRMSPDITSCTDSQTDKLQDFSGYKSPYGHSQKKEKPFMSIHGDF